MKLSPLACAVALVALSSSGRVSGQTPTNIWTNDTTGSFTWGTGGNWDVAPAAGGSNTTILQFNASSATAYTANNDLAGNFLLNGLLLNSTSSGTITISGNPLEFVTDPAGPTLPVLNQNNTGAVTISSNVVLTNNLTIGGTGTGVLTISGVISGPGTLTMNNSVGETVLTNATNSFAGTTVQAGRLVATAVGTLGAGTVNLSGGILTIRSDSAQVFTNALNVTANSTIESSRATAGTAALQTLGNLTINGSQLSFSAGSLLNANTAYTMAVGTTTVTATGATFTVNNNGTGLGTVNLGAFGTSAAAAVTKNGSGILNLNAAGGTQTAGSSITISAGTLRQTNAGALSTNVALNLNGGTYEIFNATAANPTGTITVQADSSIILNRGAGGNAVAYSNTAGMSIGTNILSMSQLQASNANNTVSYTLTGGSTFTGNPTFNLNGVPSGTVINVQLTFTGAINPGTGLNRTVTVTGNTVGFLNLPTALGGTNAGLDVIVNGGNLQLRSFTSLRSGTATPSVTLSTGSTSSGLDLLNDTAGTFVTGLITVTNDNRIRYGRSNSGAQTDQIAGNLTINSSNLVLNVVNITAGTAEQLTLGTVALTGSPTFTVNNNGTNPTTGRVVLGAIAETGVQSLTKAGTGTLILNGATNAYTGGTSVNNGVLQFNGISGLPSSGAILVNAGGAVSFNNFSAANLATAISQLSTSSAGSLALQGANNAAANIDLTGYTNLTLGATANAGVTYTGIYTPATAGVYRFGGGGGTLTYNQNITGTSSVVINHNSLLGSSLVLGGAASNYSGGTTFSGGGLLRITTPQALGGTSLLAAGNLTVNGGTFDMINPANTNVTYFVNPTFAASASLRVAQSGTTTANAFVTATVGNLTIGSFTLTTDENTFAATSSYGIITQAVILTGNPTFVVGAGNGASTNPGYFTFGNITGTGNITLNNSGTDVAPFYILNGAASSFTGTVTVNNAKLQIANTGAIAATNTITLANAASILEGVIDSNTTFNANVIVSGSGATVRAGRATAGAGVVDTFGTLSLGAVTLNIRPGVVMNTVGASGVGTPITTNTTYGVSFGATTLTGNAVIDVGNNGTAIGTATLSSLAMGANGLTKTGAGTLIINGTTTGTGGFTLTAGTLQFGSAAGISGSNAFAFGASSTSVFQLLGTDFTIGSLSTNATPGTPAIENGIASPAATLTVNQTTAGTYAGALRDGTGSAALSFVKNGAAVLTLSGTNTYTGGTTINAGVLQFNTAASVPGTGTILVGPNAAAGLGGSTQGDIDAVLAKIDATSTGSVALTSAAAALNVNLAGLPNVYLGAVGTVTYTTGTYTPATAGVYQLGGGSGTLNYNAAITGGSSVFIGSTAGTGGGGIVAFAGASTNTFTGGLTLQNLILQVGNTTNAPSFYLGSGDVTFAGGTLDLRNDAGTTVTETVNMGASGSLLINRVTGAATATTHTITNFIIPTGTQALTVGTTNITSGTGYGLTLTNLTATGSGTFTVNNNGAGVGLLTLGTITGAGGVTVAGSGNTTVGTASAGFTGTLTNSSSGTMTVSASTGATTLATTAGTMILTTSQASAATINITGGVFRQDNGDFIAANPTINLAAGGTYRPVSNTINSSFTGQNDYAFVVTGTGTATVSLGTTVVNTTAYTTTFGTLSIGTQTLAISQTGVNGGSVAGNNTLSVTFGAVTLTGNPTFNQSNNGSGVATLNLGAVTGSGTITKTGTSNLTIAASALWTGTVVASAGTTTLSGANGLTAGVTVNGGTLVLNGVNTNIATNSTLSSGTLQLQVNGALGGTSLATANTVNISGGTLSLRNNASTQFFVNASFTANAAVVIGNVTATGAPTHTIGVLTIGSTNLSSDDTTIATNNNYSFATTSTTLTGNPRFIIDEGNGTGAGSINLGSVDDGGVARTISIRGGGAAANLSTLIFGSATNTFQGSFNIGDTTGAPLAATLDLRGTTQISTQPVFLSGSILRIRPVTQAGSGTNVGALGSLTSLTLTTGAIFEGASAAASTTYGIDINVTGNATLRTALQAAGSGVTNTYGNLTIDGNTLTINPGFNVTTATAYGVTLGTATFTTAAPTFTVNNNGAAGGNATLTFTGAVNDGGFGFTKNGSTGAGTVSTMILAAASNPNLTGQIAIGTGTLEIDGSTAISTAPTFGANTTLRIREAAGGAGTNTGALGSVATLNLGATAGNIFEGQKDTNATIGINLNLTGDATVQVARITSGAGVTHTYGNLTIGANNLTISAGFNVTTNSAYGVTLGSVTTSAASTYTVNNNGTANGTLTFSGAVTDSSGITKAGAGTLVIGAASAGWTGGFTQTAGTTAFNASAGIGTAILLNGGTINASAANSFVNGVTSAAGTTLNATVANAFSGASTIAGTLNVSVAGGLGGADGSITLSSGGQLIPAYVLDNATVQKTSGTSVGVIVMTTDSGNNFDFSNSTARLGANGDYTYSGTITPNTGTNTYNLGGGGGTLTVTGSLTGVTTALNVGVGGTANSVVILRPAASNTYGGGTTVTTGATLFVTDDSSLGATSGALTLNGGTFILGSATALSPTRTLAFGAAGGTLNTNGYNLTIGAVSGNFTKAGRGTVTSNVATGSPFGGGTVTANAGGLTIAPTGSGSVSLTDATGATDTWSYAGVTLRLDKGTNTDLTYTVGGGTSTAALVRNTSQFQSTGQNASYRGTLVIDAASGVAAFGTATGEKFVVNSTTLPAVTNGIVSPTIVLQTGTSPNRVGDFVTQTAGVFSAATYNSTDMTTSTNTSVVNQTTNPTIAGASTAYALRLTNVTVANGANAINLGNGSGQAGLILNNSLITGTGTIAFGAAEGVIFVGDGTNTLTTALITGTAGLTIAGPGTLAITSTAAVTGAYSGGLTINGATLQFAGNATIDTWVLGATGTGNPITLNAGTLRITATYDQVANKNIVIAPGGGTLETNSGTIWTLNDGNQLTGTGTLTKAGTGTLVLGQASTGQSNFFGAISLNAGTIQILNASGAGTGAGELSAITVASGATLDLQAASIPKMVFAQGAGFTATTGAIGTSGTVAASITGNIELTGNISIGVSNTAALTITGIIENFGAGTRSVTKVGAGTGALILANSGNTYDGGTTISAGVLQANSNGALGASGTILAINGGTFRYGAVISEISTASRPVTINASGATFDTNGFDNTITAGANLTINSAAAITKAGAGVLTMAGAYSYTGATSINQGTLLFTADQTFTGALQFGSTNAITTVGTLDLTNTSLTIGGNFTVQTNSTSNNTLIIGAGKTLTVNGLNTVIGTGLAAATTTKLATSGGGSLVVSNTAANGTFVVGGVTAAANQGNAATADFSGLSSVTITLNSSSGIVRINPVNSNNVAGKVSTLLLPTTGTGTTTITANLLTVGDSAQAAGIGDVNAVQLGSGVTTFNVNSLNIGTSNAGRDSGSITFTGATGTLTVRNAAGSGRAVFNMGSFVTTNPSTGVASANTFDVSGHTSDLLLGAVTIGIQNRGATQNNTFSFGNGPADTTSVLDMTSLTAASRTAESGNGTNTARLTNVTVNLTGGGTTIQNGILQFGDLAGTYVALTQPATINATLNVSGGTVSIGATAGTSITMARVNVGASTAALAVTSTINLTGGTTSLSGNIVKVGTTGTSTGGIANNAIVNLDGGKLTFTSVTNANRTIGTSANQVAVNAKGGELAGLFELNGGATALTKITAGTLVLSGTNQYTGGTAINGGVLNVASAGGLSTSGAGVISFGGGTLQYTAASAANDYSNKFSTADDQLYSVDTNGQTVTFATGLTSGGTVSSLTKVGAGTLILTAANTYVSGTTISGGALQIGNGGTTGSITGDVLNNGSLTFNRSNNVTFAGNITGTGSVAQNGGGKLELTSNSSTYQGGTTVNGGILAVNNTLNTASGTGTGLVTVNSTGTLQGTGYIGGSVVVNSGGVARGGNSPGTLSVTGTSSSVTFNTGSALTIEANLLSANIVDDANSSLISLTGTSGILNLNVDPNQPAQRVTINLVNGTLNPLVLDGTESYTFTLATVATAGNIQVNGATQAANTVISSNQGTVYSLGTGFTNFSNSQLFIDATGTKLQLSVTGAAVPEPHHILLVCVTVLLGGYALRRRMQKGAVA